MTWRYADTYTWMDNVRAGLGPVVLTCAVNGGVQGQESHPRLPESATEIAEEVQAAYEAGASVVHIHPRDPDNLADTARTADAFLEVNALVRKLCPDIVINNTTGASLSNDGTTHFGILEARPEMASLNLGPDMSVLRLAERGASLPHPRAAALVDDLIPWTYGLIDELAGRMKDLGVKPELELYHSGNYWVSRRLISSGLIEPPFVHQLVMGYQTSAFPTPANVIRLVEELPENSVFFCAGIGAFQVPMNTMALLLGGHVRVGLEDNLYYRRGQLLRDNAEAVARAVRIANELGRQVATPAQARQILGVSPTPRDYS